VSYRTGGHGKGSKMYSVIRTLRKTGGVGGGEHRTGAQPSLAGPDLREEVTFGKDAWYQTRLGIE
jgi:hypothetical protein